MFCRCITYVGEEYWKEFLWYMMTKHNVYKVWEQIHPIPWTHIHNYADYVRPKINILTQYYSPFLPFE